MDLSQLTITQNPDRKRYEMQVGDEIAFMEYILRKEEEMYITHTEVPKSLEGKGIGSKLAALVLEDMRKQGLKLVPLCPFMSYYIKEHPDDWDILSDQVSHKFK
ncbi:GNAT family N-acetyltransferase [Pontibacter sp. G13]|uniref:GNAT family N-acetyltransferase n=1 Tax=Pontibacter sp. G13 TaxID=3074898 RepID=UPI00288ACCEE|nr:GNAT family N-acetyltransferase [Pontibacter sp. G13]WNJ17078.1 GNAT family N-acetyltransferase [Pontibacter sp. G13]